MFLSVVLGKDIEGLSNSLPQRIGGGGEGEIASLSL